MLRRACYWAIVAPLAGGAQLISAGGEYGAAIAEWRKNYDRDLKAEKGPLYLVGQHNLREGRTKIGAGASRGIPLPDRAPKRVGSIERRGDRVTFVPAPGITVKLNGKPIGGPVVVRGGAAPNQRDRIEFGDFGIVVLLLEGTCLLMVRDRQSPYLKQFRGAVWFPVNAKYRVQVASTPYPEPKELTILDTNGRTRPSKVPGYVTFRLTGKTFRLEPVVSTNELFFMCKDRTSGRETYGAGRFLEAEMPKNGKVVLDFNKAYNPYCAFNPYASCPIPPKQNILLTRIEAGEKYRGEH
jgi:uncharacterized protein (DUF1684 family)